jgi:hypothetical protein
MILDKDKPFIETIGETTSGHRYTQDDIRYMADGTLCKKQTTEGKECLAAKKKEAEAAMKAAEEALKDSEKK